MIDPDSAQAVLAIRFCRADERRMRELMEKNNQALLTREELAEMEAFRRIGSFLAIAHAKARQSLAGNKESHSDGT